MKKIIVLALTFVLIFQASAINKSLALSGDSSAVVSCETADNETTVEIIFGVKAGEPFSMQYLCKYTDKLQFVSSSVGMINPVSEGVIKVVEVVNSGEYSAKFVFKAAADVDGKVSFCDILISDGEVEAEVPEATINVLIMQAKKGDINGDGKINAADLTRLKKILAGLVEDVNVTAADLNGSNKVDAPDLTRLKKFLAGIITDLN